MSGINSHTAQLVMSFLTARETATLAQTCKLFRNEAAKNACIVVTEHILFGQAKPGMTWEKQEQSRGRKPCFQKHYASTKQNAMALVEELKKDEKTFAIKVGFAKDFNQMGWWNYGKWVLFETMETENYSKNGKWVFKWQR